MSNTKNAHNFLKNIDKVCFTATLVIVCLILMSLIGGYFWGLAKGKSAVKTQLNQNNQAVLSATVPKPPITGEKYSYTGNVVRIDGKAVYIETTAINENGQTSAITIKINVPDNATITKLDVSKPPLPPKAGEKDERVTVAQFSDIKQGDRIVAQAGENIKDKTEFSAKEVAILVQGN